MSTLLIFFLNGLTNGLLLFLIAAGLTTIFGVMGILNFAHGSLYMLGAYLSYSFKEIVGLTPNLIVQAGIGRSFQITSIFPNLTVAQNIRVAVISLQRKQFDFWTKVQQDRSLNQAVKDILELVGIEALAQNPVNLLSHGDRSLVEIAIILALKPRLILLDEPTAGMSREEAQKIVQLIKQLQQATGCTFLITEHDLEVVFNLAESIIVMHQGQILLQGDRQAVSDSPEVRRVYLGT